jgi:hypothetical protein
MRDTIYVSRTDGTGVVAWTRRRVRELTAPAPDGGIAGVSRDEKFLEDVLTEQPELLDLASDDHSSDIERPFKAFRQRALRALNGRTIYPDVLLVSQNGHVAVVEVKLVDNPELRDRHIIAQVLEYAAVLSECSESDLVLFFGGDSRTTWTQLVHSWFPDVADAQRLARRLIKRFRDRELHLVIACDEAPPGLRELVSAVAGQAAIGEFMFRVVEICPHVSKDSDAIAWRTNTLCQTEILQRIEIAISTPDDVRKPSVQVTVTSLEDAQARARDLEEEVTGNGWTETSFFVEAQRRLGTEKAEAVRQAYDAIVSKGYRPRWNKNAKTGAFAVMFPVAPTKPSIYIDANGSLWFQFKNLPVLAGEQARQRLLEIPGLTFDASKQYTSIPVEMWAPRFGPICDIFDALNPIDRDRGSTG